MKNISRIMGVIWIITSFAWVVLSISGLLYGLKWLENLEMGLNDNLILLVDSLDSVHGIVTETTDVVSSTQTSLGSIQLSVYDASNAFDEARPLLWTTTKVVTNDVPAALDGVQESMPSLIATAKSVDETLIWLSNFGFTIPNPFGADFSYDLGIDYDPDVPLDQAMENMSGNLEGVPDDLREMEESLNNADENLVVISDDLASLAGDLDILNEQIADIYPRLDALAASIENIQDSFEDMQDGFPHSFETARKILMGILVLLIITQIPTIYLGWVFSSGKLLVTGA
jgi:hypothetical protein